MRRAYLFLMLFLVLAVAAFAQADDGPVMPGIVALVAAVAVVTQFIKKAINNSNFGILKRIIIQKKGAVILAVLTSFGVVIFYALKTGTPINFDLLVLGGEVAIAATMGYSLLTAKK